MNVNRGYFYSRKRRCAIQGHLSLGEIIKATLTGLVVWGSNTANKLFHSIKHNQCLVSQTEILNTRCCLSSCPHLCVFPLFPTPMQEAGQLLSSRSLQPRASWYPQAFVTEMPANSGLSAAATLSCSTFPLEQPGCTHRYRTHCIPPQEKHLWI